jgi:hypothetical protein
MGELLQGADGQDTPRSRQAHAGWWLAQQNLELLLWHAL